MNGPDHLMDEVAALRERLSQLSEASLRINQSLDLAQVLQDVLDCARALTGARYGSIHLRDDSGWFVDVVTSGGTPEQAQAFWEMPNAGTFGKHLEQIEAPQRIPDFMATPKPRVCLSSLRRSRSVRCRRCWWCLSGIRVTDSAQSVCSRSSIMPPTAATRPSLGSPPGTARRQLGPRASGPRSSASRTRRPW